MRRLLMLFIAIGCVASLSCQTYTTGLVQSSGRVDEIAAISTLRAIANAQTAYSISHTGDYGTFEQLVEGGYLDQRFNSSKPRLPGYFLTMTASPKSGSSAEGSYQCNADPDETANAAGRHFYLSSGSTAIHVNAKQPATENDQALQP